MELKEFKEILRNHDELILPIGLGRRYIDCEELYDLLFPKNKTLEELGYEDVYGWGELYETYDKNDRAKQVIDFKCSTKDFDKSEIISVNLRGEFSKEEIKAIELKMKELKSH
jgi:hypothetical protein